MEQTGLYYLSKLPYKVQVQILKNIGTSNGSPTIADLLQDEWEDFSDFIQSVFVWSYTSEGHGYWSKLKNEYSHI